MPKIPFAEAPIALPRTHVTTLPNGLTLVVAERHGLPLVAVRLEIWAGSAQDGPKKEGLADFTAQLLRRGTKTRSADAIDAAIEQVGGGMGIDVGPDSIGMAVSLPSEHLGAALEVVADLAMAPRFAPAEVAAAKQRTLAGLANDLDDPSTIADKAISFVALGKHPYAHPMCGWARTVRTFNRAEVVAFHARAFAPDRAALFVVGDVDAAKVEKLARKHFGAWKRKGEAFVDPGMLAPMSERQVVVVDKDDATQTQLRIATVGIPRGHPDAFPSVVAAGVLGGGFTSRLMEEIRVNRGLSYGVSSRFHPYRYGGEFAISTFTKTETTEETIQVALDITRGLAKTGPSEEELRRTKTYLNGLYPLQLETNEQLARILSDIRLYGLGDDHVARFRERISAVSAGEAQAAAKAYFPLERFTLVAVGRAKSIVKALQPFGKRVQVMKVSALE